MLELNPSEYSSILTVIKSSKQEVIPAAIGQGVNPGRIFVDQMINPQIILIWSTVGYYFLFGDPTTIDDYSALSNTITEIFVPASQATGETGFILIPSSDAWKLLLPALLPNRQPVEIFRQPHDFDINLFKHSKNLGFQIPSDLQLKPIDEPIAKNIQITASWSSLADFFTNGIGYILFKNGELATTCVSVFSSSEKVELDVHTQEKFRRQGLAELVCAAFIEKCIQSGKSPNWECFWNNEPSLKLATKLGFEKCEKYSVYYWEE